MTEEQLNLVNPILNTFENKDIKDFAKVLLDDLPDYVWHVGASSTGKYHPQYSLSEGGLMRHQLAVVRFINYFIGLEQYNNVIPSRKRDLMRLACLVHDGRKSGTQEEYAKSKYTKFAHPKLMADVIKSYSGKYLTDQELEFAAGCINSHMGQWSTDKKSSEVLPKPEGMCQELVHLADYLASRKDLTMDFENAPQVENKPIDINEYVLSFGKYKGQKLIDVYYKKPDYVDWMEESITRPEVQEAIKVLRKKIEEDDDEL